ncbi:MAG: hypothetical protein RSD47_11790 [Romboutsia sp.]
MRRQKFYNYLCKKYHLPYVYIKFIIKPICIYAFNYSMSKEDMNSIENNVRWNRVQEEFEFLNKYRKDSVFYGIENKYKNEEEK